MSRSPINEGRNSPNRQRATPVELTSVHQRASRRLRGNSPEFGPLSFTSRETRTTDAATMTSQVIRDPEPKPQPARHVPTYSDVLRQPAVQSSTPVATTVTYPPTARSASRVFQPTAAYRPPAHSVPRFVEQTEKKIDTLIRVGLKSILGIPQTTSTEWLLELGLHNTVDELIEVHFAAQVARLSSTKAGLKILDEAGIAVPRVEVFDGVQLTRDEREDI
ncbi:hypothetical protein HPB50_008285 [Hyalomma asiaticum]|uniref:Uncharacterized protein n=1 Tax=Hyalomma asiaticum TaxID=266040 RepID=A0ACB7SNT1_HYAAI|nr:hypothetical protein HPB50_008285 [Hyalomma asiaticum]